MDSATGFYLTAEHLQWLLIFVTAGYVPICSATGIVFWQLLKAKDNEVKRASQEKEIYKQVLPVIEKLLHVIERLEFKFGGRQV